MLARSTLQVGVFSYQKNNAFVHLNEKDILYIHTVHTRVFTQMHDFVLR